MTVAQYLGRLPAERRRVMARVRALIRKHLPKGYKESYTWGAICYVIPLSRHPGTYNGQPLPYVGLAAHKTFYTLYLYAAYSDPAGRRWIERQFRKAGKRFDMGKSCLHFKTVDDLPVETIATVIASRTPEQLIALYQSVRSIRTRAAK